VDVAVANAILVVNAGSSSLKLRLLSDADPVLGSADLPAPRGLAEAAELKAAIGSLG
jgi:acetate kinase